MSVHIELSQGVLSGIQEDLPNGKEFYSFRGIPYAETPERFKEAVLVGRNKDVILDCTKERSICIQKDMISNTFIGSEDCLYLNVYTPKQSSGTTVKTLPVMVWIHGGAFIFGSGDSDFYSPEYLLEEDVVVVTINYRLSVLGFISLPGVPGNLGLRDQLLALKWVSQNISKFNGDPNNVTIFGESAGGASVHLHYISPESRKYFHKAICQSGVSLMPWVIQTNPEEKTRLLAEICGCKAKTDAKILEFLKTAPLDKLITAIPKTLSADEKRRSFGLVFTPFVEKSGPGAIVTKAPLVAMREMNAIQDIPLIVGVNDKEGILMLRQRSGNYWELYDNDITRLIPQSVNLSPGSMSSGIVGEEIRKFYFDEKPITEDSIPVLADVFTDIQFDTQHNVCSEVHAKYQHKAQQYYYYFTFDGELNLFKQLFGFDHLKGACHADEVPYLFTLRIINQEVDRNSKEWALIKNMCKMWTNFAKFGNPTPDSSLPYKWAPVKNIDPKSKEFTIDALEIGDEIKMIEGPNKQRVDFWRKVYTKWNDDFLKPKL